VERVKRYMSAKKSREGGRGTKGLIKELGDPILDIILFCYLWILDPSWKRNHCEGGRRTGGINGKKFLEGCLTSKHG